MQKKLDFAILSPLSLLLFCLVKKNKLNTQINREQQLSAWINQYTDFECESLEIVSGDASFRRYFRFEDKGQTIIAVDAPPEYEDASRFIAVASSYANAGVSVPKIYAYDLELGFYLQQDFGDTLLSDALNDNNCDELYAKALVNIPLIQQCLHVKETPLPAFDGAFIDRELGLFKQWLLDRYLEVSLTAEEQNMLTDTLEAIKQRCLSQPTVGVHRDYHSRNLMILAEGEIGVIDFQDAVVGPITYDAVSLLRDSYQNWPADKVERWLMNWHKQCYSMYSWADFKMWFDSVGMQRHIKIAGIFARLAIRDNKPSYLQDIPHTLNYLIYELGLYPEFAHMQSWLTQRILPALRNKLGNVS